MMGIVKRPHEKYSKNITTNAWYTEGSPMPELCKDGRNKSGRKDFSINLIRLKKVFGNFHVQIDNLRVISI